VKVPPEDAFKVAALADEGASKPANAIVAKDAATVNLANGCLVFVILLPFWIEFKCVTEILNVMVFWAIPFKRSARTSRTSRT
jgi:hypothetical protein